MQTPTSTTAAGSSRAASRRRRGPSGREDQSAARKTATANAAVRAAWVEGIDHPCSRTRDRSSGGRGRVNASLSRLAARSATRREAAPANPSRHCRARTTNTAPTTAARPQTTGFFPPGMTARASHVAAGSRWDAKNMRMRRSMPTGPCSQNGLPRPALDGCLAAIYAVEQPSRWSPPGIPPIWDGQEACESLHLAHVLDKREKMGWRRNSVTRVVGDLFDDLKDLVDDVIDVASDAEQGTRDLFKRHKSTEAAVPAGIGQMIAGLTSAIGDLTTSVGHLTALRTALMGQIANPSFTPSLPVEVPPVVEVPVDLPDVAMPVALPEVAVPMALPEVAVPVALPEVAVVAVALPVVAVPVALPEVAVPVALPEVAVPVALPEV